jgi:hypothetical protein
MHADLQGGRLDVGVLNLMKRDELDFVEDAGLVFAPLALLELRRGIFEAWRIAKFQISVGCPASSGPALPGRDHESGDGSMHAISAFRIQVERWVRIARISAAG